MDPNETLKQLRVLMTAFQLASDAGDEIETEDAFQAAELFLGLDAWIEKGGFLPDVWKK